MSTSNTQPTAGESTGIEFSAAGARAAASGSDRYAAAVGRYVDDELDLAAAAEAAGLSRWEFVTRLREAGIAEPAGAGERQ